MILIHGPPGTGKSMTAHCVADHFKLPLLLFNLGRSGTKAQEFENHLNETIQLAERWNCIILIDNADILLEERSVSDIERNSVVAGMY